MKCLLPSCNIEGVSHFSGCCSHAHRKAAFSIARRMGLDSLMRQAARESEVMPTGTNEGSPVTKISVKPLASAMGI